MENKRWVISLIAVWTGAIALFLYIPIFSVIVSSFGKSRYFRFPVKAWSDKWYDQTLNAQPDRARICTSPRSMSRAASR